MSLLTMHMNPYETFASGVVARLERAAEGGDADTESSSEEWNLQAVYEDLDGLGAEIELLPGPLIYESSSIPSILEGDRNTRAEDAEGGGESLIEAAGMEALAFYKPFHSKGRAPFAGRWGAFIFEWAPGHIASRLQDDIVTAGSPGFGGDEYFAIFWQGALELLLGHELHHYKVEVWTTILEGVTHRPYYSPYTEQVYARYFPGAECVEEAWANREALDRLLQRGPEAFGGLWPVLKNDLKHSVRELFDRSPPAYRGYDAPPDKVEHVLAAQIGGHRWQSGSGDRTAAEALFRADSLLEPGNCPVCFIRSVPPHRHPLLAPPKVRELRVFVTRYLNGVRESRSASGGDNPHPMYRIDNGGTVQLPNTHGGQQEHAEAFQGALRAAGMSRPEFWRERLRTKKWKRNVPREEVLDPITV